MAVVTGYKWQLEKLERMQQDNGWTALRVLSADTCQGAEWNILIASLVRTSEPPGFIGMESRANVVTTRAREARYFVGNWTKFWHRKPDKKLTAYETMFSLLQNILYNDGGKGFVVGAQ